MMIIKGKYERDSNFVTIYGDDNRLYTISRATGDWASIDVGKLTCMGKILTQEWFNEHRDASSNYCTIVLEDD